MLETKGKELNLKSFLGDGDHGAVYEAVWSKRNEDITVAVKFLNAEHFSPELIRSAIPEARDCRYLTRILSYFYEDERDHHVLIMERMSTNLVQLIRKSMREHKSPLTTNDCKTVMLQVALGMKFLHSKANFHAPLKASHILLNTRSQELEVKLSSAWLNSVHPQSHEHRQENRERGIYDFAMIFKPFLEKDDISLQDLMERCRDEDPEKRPGFEVICENLVLHAGPLARSIHLRSKLRIFTVKELSNATKRFRSMMGKGTYKGTLEGKLVLVKNIFHGVQLEELEKLGEFNHEFLLSPKGYCLEKGAAYLIYDFISTMNLQSQMKDLTFLSWNQRMRIVLDVAKGLEYLHSKHLIHTDVHLKNVFLDFDFKARLKMEIVYEEPMEVSSTTLVGRKDGYAAPELVLHWKVSTKSDVYSFGILLLVLVCGKPSVSSIIRTLAASQERIVQLVKVKHRSLEKVVHIAVKCTNDDPLRRPTMHDVVHELSKLSHGEDSRLDVRFKE